MGLIMSEKKKKKKIRFKGLIILILFGYLIITIGTYLWQTPVKNIEIKGNYYLKDNYLISYLNLENKSIFKISSHKIKKQLLNLDLISNVKVRKNFLGKLTINITEDKILFYNWNNKKIILSSNKEIPYNENYLGVPTLINYVKDTVYEEFVKNLAKIDRDNLALISEIEYSPSVVKEEIVDDKRFLFRMNDGNIVYVNTINIEKFNDYLEIYELIKNKNGDIKGCLYLDSNSDNNHFDNCEEDKIVDESESKNES